MSIQGLAGRRIRSIGALVLGAALLVPAAADAAPDRIIAVTSDNPADWQGPAATASNQQTDGEPCGKSANNYCDSTLLNVGSPSGDATLTVDVDDFSTPIDDFDLVVYRSNAAGERGEKIGSSGNVASMPESL